MHLVGFIIRIFHSLLNVIFLVVTGSYIIILQFFPFYTSFHHYSTTVTRQYTIACLALKVADSSLAGTFLEQSEQFDWFKKKIWAQMLKPRFQKAKFTWVMGRLQEFWNNCTFRRKRFSPVWNYCFMICVQEHGGNIKISWDTQEIPSLSD